MGLDVGSVNGSLEAADRGVANEFAGGVSRVEMVMKERGQCWKVVAKAGNERGGSGGGLP